MGDGVMVLSSDFLEMYPPPHMRCILLLIWCDGVK
jgi:hypothetical protein